MAIQIPMDELQKVIYKGEEIEVWNVAGTQWKKSKSWKTVWTGSLSKTLRTAGTGTYSLTPQVWYTTATKIRITGTFKEGLNAEQSFAYETTATFASNSYSFLLTVGGSTTNYAQLKTLTTSTLGYQKYGSGMVVVTITKIELLA